MRTIRASEIGHYMFCRRAWWYQQQGATSENLGEMTAGSSFHHAHGRALVWAGLLKGQT
jgi:CRISPR/Cas system-associated exonuclease Cas4 (RecB family)